MKKLIIFTLLLIFTVTFSNAQKPTETTTKAVNLMVNGDIPGAIKVLDKGIAKKKDLFESYKLRSHLRMFSGDIKGAISDLDEAIKINPSEAETYARRADLKIFLRDETAFDDYNFAIANGYKTYKVYVGRGVLQRNLGNSDAAIADFRTALGLNPDAAQAAVGLASALEQKGEIDESISILNDFLSRYEMKVNGNLPKSEMRVIDESSIVKDDEAGYGTNQVILKGKSVEIDLGVGTKQTAEAQTNQMENNMNISLAYANLARMQEQKGLLDEAFSNIEKSIKMNKKDGYSIGIRGKIYLAKKEYQKALKDFDVSILMMPTIPNYYAERGITYLILGFDEKAQADFDKFLEINPRGKVFLDKRIEESKRTIAEVQ